MRSGLLVVVGTSEQADGTAAGPDTVADVPAMEVGAPGHADILREASHYLSAIKVRFAVLMPCHGFGCWWTVCRRFINHANSRFRARFGRWLIRV